MKDIYSPSQSAQENTPSGAFTSEPGSIPGAPVNDMPELNFDIPELDDIDNLENFTPDFYGSYGEAVKEADPYPAEAVPGIPDTVPEYNENENDNDEVFTPVLNFSQESAGDTHMSDVPDVPETPFIMPEEDLMIPDMPAPVSDPTRVTKKSMGYETTVKLKNARHAERNEERINEPIRKDSRPTFTPKQREFNGIASGTAHVSGGLPELKDNQMYVAITPKELRRLKSRKFRGLGVLSALCLGIIAAFCIWSYVHSFADPIIGRWKGNVSSVALGIDALKELDQESMASTWEFNSSGSMYINLVLNDTPVSLSGSYSKLTDSDGEQYLTMTLKNPMDNNDYTVNMYYTITGNILQFNDMDGVGAEIDLTKE